MCKRSVYSDYYGVALLPKLCRGTARPLLAVRLFDLLHIRLRSNSAETARVGSTSVDVSHNGIPDLVFQ